MPQRPSPPLTSHHIFWLIYKGPGTKLCIKPLHLIGYIYLWCNLHFLHFLHFWEIGYFSNFLQNPSAVLCQPTTIEPPHRGHADLYVQFILVIGSQLQTTGTGPHVGFTWNGKYRVNAYTWNVIYMVNWHISYTYYCYRCCCCLLIQLTDALTNCAIAPAQMNEFCNISNCVPWNHSCTTVFVIS